MLKNKKLFALLFLFAILFTGCSDKVSMPTPTIEKSIQPTKECL